MRSFTRSSLTAKHQLHEFDCGRRELNQWVQEHALSMHQRNHCRVFIWTDPHSPNPDAAVAFYALSAMSVQRRHLPPRAQRGEMRDVPAILLGKLALDLALQGQGLASRLLADAVITSARAAQSIGARFMVADPIDEEVASLYALMGFMRSDTARMYARLDELMGAMHIARELLKEA